MDKYIAFRLNISPKKLNPWLNTFYGDLHLKINQSDSAFVGGNMDWGTLKIQITSPFKFLTPGRTDNPSFEYLEDKDMILLKTNDVHSKDNYSVIFRRLRKGDAKQVIANEEEFNEYFINKFFTEDYFTGVKKPNIVTIRNGFETFTPMNFDAIEIKNEKGKKDVYGWEINNDTLKLYSISFKTDEESGFRIGKKGELTQVYIKKK